MAETEKTSIIDGMIEEGRQEQETYLYLKKLSETDEISKDQVEKALEATCHGHFAGCCGPEKECPIQLTVCEALGLDPEELYQVKKNAVDAWLRGKNK